MSTKLKLLKVYMYIYLILSICCQLHISTEPFNKRFIQHSLRHRKYQVLSNSRHGKAKRNAITDNLT